MIFGFNTDLRVGDSVYHVQTEDRGPGNPVIDTTVYSRGRILHRRVSDYKELIATLEFAPERLRERLEAQHRAIIEELRAGTLKFDEAAAAPAPAPATGIQVQLMNPASWLAAGTATLKLEVKSKASGEAVADANLQITVSGVQGPVHFPGKTNRDGRADISFPLPRTGGGGMELVIRASSAEASDEIRYSLKPKPRT